MIYRVVQTTSQSTSIAMLYTNVRRYIRYLYVWLKSNDKTGDWRLKGWIFVWWLELRTAKYKCIPFLSRRECIYIGGKRVVRLGVKND